MTTLHILINPEKELIVAAVHEGQMDPTRGVRRFIKHHTEQEGRSLARVIVRAGSPVKVIQAGEEEVAIS